MSIDIPTGIDEAMTKLGSSEAQRQDAVLVLAPLCERVADVVVLKATRAGLEAAESKAWLDKHKPHLLPPKFERSLADRAFLDGGNLTARGALLREVGEAEANRIAQSYGLRNMADTRRGTRPEGASEEHSKPNGKDRSANPWRAGQWNISEQGRLVRALGVEKAAQIAASVGCSLGSTHPNPNY